jgi:hypothetical protein
MLIPLRTLSSADSSQPGSAPPWLFSSSTYVMNSQSQIHHDLSPPQTWRDLKSKCRGETPITMRYPWTKWLASLTVSLVSGELTRLAVACCPLRDTSLMVHSFARCTLSYRSSAVLLMRGTSQAGLQTPADLQLGQFVYCANNSVPGSQV